MPMLFFNAERAYADSQILAGRRGSQMFCPSCGLEERQPSQFCRSCGTDLRTVRAGLETPDSLTESAKSAREEIGHAVALKIRELEKARDLRQVAEDVL